jgi:hypothetical protein
MITQFRIFRILFKCSIPVVASSHFKLSHGPQPRILPSSCDILRIGILYTYCANISFFFFIATVIT